MMKRAFFLLISTFCLNLFLQGRKQSIVRIETSEGNLRVELSDLTPVHRDNFLELAENGFYEGILFHRVIQDFMIQAGDPKSKGAEPGVLLGETDVGYTLVPEFNLPFLYHWRGALAAAREGDDINPDQRSSGSQFYIVYGKKQTTSDINKISEKLAKNGVTLTRQMIMDYEQNGGVPHLDGSYTVFGEVIEGMDIVRHIQLMATDKNDRPLQDVVIKKMVVERKSKAAKSGKDRRRHY
jgi:peptidyl-prolyl cis-trans isomerase B (cyclophilin B)